MAILAPKRHTDKTGDISEYAAITRLLECGYSVLQPLGQMHRYDLVIEDGGKFLRVQVKTGWLDHDDSCNTYHYYGVNNRAGTTRRSYTGQCEYFCVYLEKLWKVYLIPINEAGGTLRLTPTKNGQEKHVRWAKDYEL